MSKELVKVDVKKYPMLAADAGNVGAIIAENLGGEEITPGDLPRIKMPSGESTLWPVMQADGDQSAEKHIQGIIVSIQPRRGYWAKQGAPDGSFPDCSSNDCATGVGEPGGACIDCPFAKFGTKIDEDGTPGNGQACRKTKLIFMLREGNMLPDIVTCGTGSLDAMKKWQLRVSVPGSGMIVPYYSVVSRLALKTETNKKGTKYPQIVPSVVAALPPDAVKGVRDYATSLQSVFSRVVVERDEPGGGAEM